MEFATISADIIAYTSLLEEDRRRLDSDVKGLLQELTKRYRGQSFFGRMVQGDFIECALNSPRHALRIALLLKTFVKSFEPAPVSPSVNQFKYFREHGIRFAIAIGKLDTFSPAKGIIDGEAIYVSGRTIKGFSTSEKQKIIIKNTMFFRIGNKQLQEQFETILMLLDTIISRCSSKQSEILFYKLLDFSEKEISRKLAKTQSTISQHSTAAGWLAIEKAVNHFEKTIL